MVMVFFVSDMVWLRKVTRLANRNQRRTLPPMSFVRTISGALFFVLLFALSQALGGEAKSTTTPKTKMGTLIIKFSGLQNNKGKVLAGLYDEEKKFPKENLALRNLKEPPKNKTCTIKTMNLPYGCLLYTSPSPRDATLSRMPSSA